MAPPKGKVYNIFGEGGRPPIWTTEIIEKEAEELVKWLQLPSSYWFEQFAIDRGYPSKYLHEWAAKNDKFRGAYELARDWQKSKLVCGSLLKKFNAGTAHLVLSSSYGMHLKEETAISGSTDNPLSIVMSQVTNNSKDLIDEEKQGD
jgi:hypothetical protein